MSNKKRGDSYKIPEIENFLTIMEMHLPLSRNDWQIVAEEHAERYANKNRSFDSIKKKYNKLVQEGPSTGDPNCPDYIRRAKRLHFQIYKKSEMQTGSDSETKTDNNDDEYEELDNNDESDEDDDAEVEVVTLGQPSSQESTTPASTRRRSPRHLNLQHRVTPREAETNFTPRISQNCSSSSSSSNKKRNASRSPQTRRQSQKNDAEEVDKQVKKGKGKSVIERQANALLSASFPYNSSKMSTARKRNSKKGSGTSSSGEDMFELMKLQLMHRFQEQESRAQEVEQRRESEAEERRIHQQQLLQQNQMMMMLIANSFNSRGNGGVMNMASHDLHIDHTSQRGAHKGTSPSVHSGSSGGSGDSGSSGTSNKSAKSYFSVRSELPKRDPGVQTEDLIGDVNNMSGLTPPFAQRQKDSPSSPKEEFTPISKMANIEKEEKTPPS